VLIAHLFEGVLGCCAVQPRVASAETLSSFQEINKSPYIKPYKTILHPGEVLSLHTLHVESNCTACCTLWQSTFVEGK
jgi:hypothetical protein